MAKDSFKRILPARGAFRVNDFVDTALSSVLFLFTRSALPLFDFFLNKVNCPFLEVLFSLPFFLQRAFSSNCFLQSAFIRFIYLLAPLSNFFLQCAFYLMHFFLPSAFVCFIFPAMRICSNSFFPANYFLSN